MNTCIFDIETGPLPEAELEAMLPKFDPAEVKVGNIKDPAKIAEKIAEAEANHRKDFFEKAALDPLTGRVLAIGLHDGNDMEPFSVIASDSEESILTEFWIKVRGDMGRVNQMIGFNTHLFDLPFLIRRSWKHRVEVPWGVRRGRYWGDEMVDLRNEWQLGDRQAKGSLDAICKHLGLGQKSGSGADFARLWVEDRPKAIEYLKNDLLLTAKLAQVLGY
jgi:uncharacterized protein YprB with RNaseH-like and TPR domain